MGLKILRCIYITEIAYEGSAGRELHNTYAHAYGGRLILAANEYSPNAGIMSSAQHNSLV